MDLFYREVSGVQVWISYRRATTVVQTRKSLATEINQGHARSRVHVQVKGELSRSHVPRGRAKFDQLPYVVGSFLPGFNHVSFLRVNEFQQISQVLLFVEDSISCNLRGFVVSLREGIDPHRLPFHRLNVSGQFQVQVFSKGAGRRNAAATILNRFTN